MVKPRVLVIAEACNPEWVSVPLVGFSHAEALRRVADVHVVTQVRNREALLRHGWVEGIDFTAIDSEKIAAPLSRFSEKIRGGKGKGWTTKMAINAFALPYFERLTWQLFEERLRRGDFHVVHQITPLSPTLPPRLAPRCRRIDVPFIWGPINGGVAWPKGFDAARREEKEWLSYVRNVYKLVPGYARCRKACTRILVASKASMEQMPARFQDKCIYLPENAIDPARFNRRKAHATGRPIKAVFLGRLVPYKGCDILLEAAAPLLQAGDLTLTIIGDGPQRPALEAFIQQHHLQSSVQLIGWMEHAQVQDELAKADIMPFPSVREFGGGVALEAMAVGCVPIVPNYGGLGELVTPATGYLLPLTTRQKLIEDLRQTLAHVVEHPAEIDARSAAGLERVAQEFTWDAKAQQVLKIYNDLM